MVPDRLLPGIVSGLGSVLSNTLKVPYYRDREDSKREAPDCYMNVDQALERLGGKTLLGVYAHMPSLNLVLVTEDDRIGIRFSCLDKGYPTLWDRLEEQGQSDAPPDQPT